MFDPCRGRAFFALLSNLFQPEHVSPTTAAVVLKIGGLTCFRSSIVGGSEPLSQPIGYNIHDVLYDTLFLAILSFQGFMKKLEIRTASWDHIFVTLLRQRNILDVLFL